MTSIIQQGSKQSIDNNNRLCEIYSYYQTDSVTKSRHITIKCVFCNRYTLFVTVKDAVRKVM